MSTKHTPTPWHFTENSKKTYIYSSHRNGAYCAEISLTDDSGNKIKDAQSNASHIVKSVNLMPEMIEALDILLYKMPVTTQDWDKCKDLLKRAKGDAE